MKISNNAVPVADGVAKQSVVDITATVDTTSTVYTTSAVDTTDHNPSLQVYVCMCSHILCVSMYDILQITYLCYGDINLNYFNYQLVLCTYMHINYYHNIRLISLLIGRSLLHLQHVKTEPWY